MSFWRGDGQESDRVWRDSLAAKNSPTPRGDPARRLPRAVPQPAPPPALLRPALPPPALLPALPPSHRLSRAHASFAACRMAAVRFATCDGRFCRLAEAPEPDVHGDSFGRNCLRDAQSHRRRGGSRLGPLVCCSIAAPVGHHAQYTPGLFAHR